MEVIAESKGNSLNQFRCSLCCSIRSVCLLSVLSFQVIRFHEWKFVTLRLAFYSSLILIQLLLLLKTFAMSLKTFALSLSEHCFAAVAGPSGINEAWHCSPSKWGIHSERSSTRGIGGCPGGRATFVVTQRCPTSCF